MMHSKYDTETAAIPSFACCGCNTQCVQILLWMQYTLANAMWSLLMKRHQSILVDSSTGRYDIRYSNNKRLTLSSTLVLSWKSKLTIWSSAAVRSTDLCRVQGSGHYSESTSLCAILHPLLAVKHRYVHDVFSECA